MLHYAVAVGLLLHSLYWGAGLAGFLLPRRWRTSWPLFVPFAGWALQSAVVWFGALGARGGTDSYIWLSEVLPALLLAALFWRRGLLPLKEFSRAWPVGLLSLLCLAALVWPMSRATKGLSTSSMGSCDAADYAAGARVFKELAPSDRSGFIGQTEVVQVYSVNNFHDYFRRLNHFTPSALIAHHGSALDCAPHELTGLFTAVTLALSLPLVFWVSRILLRHGPKTSLALAALYGASPLLWYAVFQVSPAQLLAAQGIAVLNWVGITLWRLKSASLRSLLPFAGLLFAAYWLLLGSYNFILLVCLVPSFAYVGLDLLRSRDWTRVASWLTSLVLPLLLASLLFWDRAAGLIERFRLLKEYDFGWPISLLTPAAWVGVVADPTLNTAPVWLVWLVSALLLGLLGAAWIRFVTWNSRRSQVAFSLSVPALLGYTYLMIQAARLGTNASYDAYKLFCVFFPGILASLGLVTLLVVRGRGLARIAALALCAGVALASLRLCLLFIAQNSKPALVVDRALIELRRVDAMKEIGSLNLRVDAFWDRLWANSFLLHHEQYFATHTYEARLNTPMSGDWDLLGNFFTLSLPRPGDSKPVNKFFSLVNTRSPHYLKGELGQGWHQMERDAVTRWCWSRGDASIMLENPHSTPLLMSVRFDLLASSERNIKLLLNEELLGSTQVGTARGLIATKEFRLPPGRHFLRLTSTQSAQKPQAYDSRALGFCLYGVQVDLRED